MAAPLVADSQAAKIQRRSIWSWAAAIALGGVLLFKSLQGVDWARVWAAVAAARWEYLTASALTSVVSYVLRALRWRILLNAGTKEPLSAGLVFRANMAGYVGNSLLPARAGEVIRCLIVSARSSLSRGYVLTTELGERLFDAMVLVACGSLALLYVRDTPVWMGGVARSMALAAGAGALTLSMLPFVDRWIRLLVDKTGLPAGVKQKVSTLIGQVVLGVGAFHHLGRFLSFTALTGVIWTTDAAGIMLAARGLNFSVPFAAAVLLLAAMGLGSALPSTPGYVGIYQFVTVTTLAPFGVPRDIALAFSLVSQAFAYVVVIALGAPSFLTMWRKRE